MPTSCPEWLPIMTNGALWLKAIGKEKKTKDVDTSRMGVN